jgi:hypothetical protein
VSLEPLRREHGSRRQLPVAHSSQMSLGLLLFTGEWEEYLEAIRLGTTEVLRCPLQSTDVELTLIHVARVHEGQIDCPVQTGQPDPRASRVAIGSAVT